MAKKTEKTEVYNPQPPKKPIYLDRKDKLTMPTKKKK